MCLRQNGINCGAFYESFNDILEEYCSCVCIEYDVTIPYTSCGTICTSVLCGEQCDCINRDIRNCQSRVSHTMGAGQNHTRARTTDYFG